MTPQITVQRNWFVDAATARCHGCGRSRTVRHQDQVEAFVREHAKCHHPAQHEAGSWRLGDYVAHLTHAAGIPQCEACRKRQEWLNRFAVPWRRG
jgi:hypothetical protein